MITGKMVVLWFDVEKERLTIKTFEEYKATLLWFDVEKERLTITN